MVRIKKHYKRFFHLHEKAKSTAVATLGAKLTQEVQLAINESNEKGANPGSPGGPPNKGTGNLQRNIVHNHDSESAESRVGWTANADYGPELEQNNHPHILYVWERRAEEIIDLAIEKARQVFRRG